MGITKYTKEKIEEAVKDSNSIAETLRKLRIKHLSGSLHYHISKKIKEFEIDISHFKGKGWSKGCNFDKIPADTILSYNRLNGRREHRPQLLRSMLEKGKEYICSECGNGDIWNNRNIVLQIDHINGEPIDNRIENLRFLCPNCHSQTPTFSTSKLVSNHENYRSELNDKTPKKCNSCNKEISKGSNGLCRSCASTKKNKSFTKFEVTKAELYKLIWEDKLPYTKIAKMYDVSDNAIRKRCKKLNIPIRKRNQ